jgi:hypothetical protein
MLIKLCCAFLLYALVLVTTACPVSAASIQKIQDESKKVATYANTGVELTRTLYENHVFSSDPAKNLAIKDDIARGFITLAQGGVAFDATVAQAKQQYTGNVPQSQIEAFVNTFNTDIVDRFVTVLKSLKVISEGSQFATTVELLRTAVLATAAVLKIKSAVQAKLTAASA